MRMLNRRATDAPDFGSALSDATTPALQDAAARIFRMAAARDRDNAYPEQEVAMLDDIGLLLAPFPVTFGGKALGSESDPEILFDILRMLGGASLPLGRLFEGHVNAVCLVERYGSPHNLSLLLEEVEAGRLTGVWMAEREPGLSLSAAGGGHFTGGKIYCSGAGFIRRPLVAARVDGTAGPQMAIPYVPPGHRASTREWQPLGMRASATGQVDFTGLAVSPSETVGAPNDYYQSPHFRGGAWRVLAVQLGGLEALFRLYRAQLAVAPGSPTPLQVARIGEAAIDLETARLWAKQACSVAEAGDFDPVGVDAYVDLARNAFERAAFGLIERLQRGLGLRALIAPNPIERILRDLSTYLRQPALDMSLTSAAAYLIDGGILPQD